MLEKQILGLIDKKSDKECWEWRGEFHNGLNKPIFRIKQKKKILVHRFMYELENGKIPKGGTIWRSKCWNDLCCNTKHTQLIMPGETCPQKPGSYYWERKNSESNHMRSIREEIKCSN